MARHYPLVTEPKMLRACASCGEPIIDGDGRASCPHCGAARALRSAAIVMLASSALAGCLAIEPDYGIADVGTDTFEETGVTSSETGTNDTTTVADESSSSESTSGASESTSSDSTSSESDPSSDSDSSSDSGSDSTSSESSG